MQGASKIEAHARRAAASRPRPGCTSSTEDFSMSAVRDRPAEGSAESPLLPDGRTSIYQPEQSGLIYPQLPVFTDPAAERRHRQERLVAACRAFAQEGFDYGFAGHLT